LGKSLALAFAKNGYGIILHGRDRSRLRTVKKAVLENGVDCEIVSGDLTSKVTMDKLYEVASKRNIDILINNAGMYSYKSFGAMNFEESKKVLDVNLFAPIRLISSIYPIFLENKSGLIININSVAGKYPNELEAVYCASKYGLRGFSDSFRFEANKNGVCVISIYLGAMQTAMAEGKPDYEKLIRPDEAADLIFKISENYENLRVSEINLLRRRY